MHRFWRSPSSISGAIFDFRQSRLRSCSKPTSPGTQSNERLVCYVAKMMKLNYLHLISHHWSSLAWGGLAHFRFDLGYSVRVIIAGSLCPTRSVGRSLSSVRMNRAREHLSPVSRDEPYRPHRRRKPFIPKHICPTLRVLTCTNKV